MNPASIFRRELHRFGRPLHHEAIGTFRGILDISATPGTNGTLRTMPGTPIGAGDTFHDPLGQKNYLVLGVEARRYECDCLATIRRIRNTVSVLRATTAPSNAFGRPGGVLEIVAASVPLTFLSQKRCLVPSRAGVQMGDIIKTDHNVYSVLSVSTQDGISQLMLDNTKTQEIIK